VSTNQAQIAAYLAEQMGDRADKRKEAVALGLQAAEDREKVAARMRSNTEQPQTGVSGTGVSSVSLAPAEVTSPSTISGRTLGSAAVSIRPPVAWRGTRIAIALGVIGSAVAVLALVALSRGRAPAAAEPRPSHPAAAPLPPPLVTATPPAVPDPLPATVPSSAASPSSSAASAGLASLPVPVVRGPRVSSPLVVPAATPAPAPSVEAAPKPAATVVPTRVNDGF
jgi:hypothetical protein